MIEKDDEFWRLAARYLGGEASEVERERFEERLEASEESREAFRSLQQIWTHRSTMDVDVDAAWQRVRRRMIPAERAPEPRQDRRPTRRRATMRPALRLALVAALVLAIGSIVYLIDRAPTSPSEQVADARQITTGQGERLSLRLSDGSRVVLAPASELEIPGGFGAEARMVSLRGEAFFDVAASADQPFIVESARGVVEVLGTRFTVRDYPGTTEPLEVAVEEGTVETRTGADSARLTDGVRAQLIGDELLVSDITDPSIYFGWLDGRLAFRDRPMEHVAAAIERWYGIELAFYDSELASRRLTAILDGATPLEAIEIIALSIEAEVEQQDDDVYVLRRRTR